MDQDFIQKLTNTVFENLNNEQFGAEELASQIGLSRSQIHRRLHQINGKSITEFIREIRLKEAHRLLEKEAGTASEIAYMVGFGSPTYFNKCFHEYYGYTPGEVKQRINSNYKTREGSNDSKHTGHNKLKKHAHQKRKLFLSLAVICILILVVFSALSIRRNSKIKWATYQALPEIERLLKEPKMTESYNLALKAEKYIPENPELKDLFDQVSSTISIYSDPSDAEIYIKEYNNINGDWKFIGRSPIHKIRLPKTFYRWMILKDGYEPVFAALSPREETLFRKLDNIGSIPSGMVRVIGSVNENGKIPDFFIDQYEVTNKQFKAFLDEGGYQNKSYWKYPIIHEGRQIRWEEAIHFFRDRTGRPGPATWQAGNYPEGEADYPVSGVSWYEAAAYAAYAGKELPTIGHWDHAAGFNLKSNKSFLSKVILFSNFTDKGSVPIGSNYGINCYGAFDMAGNVREWCWNKTSIGRAIKGGAWNDKEYMYYNRSQLPPMNRSFKNGFRCVQYIDRSEIPEALFHPVQDKTLRNYYTDLPVSDEIFEVFKNNFASDHTSLEAKVELVFEQFDDYRIEMVSYNATYGNERIIALLYLPKRTAPPYQTIINVPNILAVSEGSIINNTQFPRLLKYFVKNGRALMFPVYFGTWERYDTLTNKIIRGERSVAYREVVTKIVKDFRSSIDYLETRKDIDSSKIAYLGSSWGARLGLIIPAVENRIKVSILSLGGLPTDPKTKIIPEIDERNYLPRITIPTLMLNGRYDHIFPFEVSIQPAFDLLGTPDHEKKLIPYNTDHYVPRNEFMKESLNWLDKYLGPVEKNINEGSSLISRNYQHQDAL